MTVAMRLAVRLRFRPRSLLRAGVRWALSQRNRQGAPLSLTAQRLLATRQPNCRRRQACHWLPVPQAEVLLPDSGLRAPWRALGQVERDPLLPMTRREGQSMQNGGEQAAWPATWPYHSTGDPEGDQ